MRTVGVACAGAGFSACTDDVYITLGNRKWEARLVMSASGQYATSLRLFDHLVGTYQNGIRDRQAQHLCCPGIDNQFKGGGFLYGNVSGLGAL